MIFFEKENIQVDKIIEQALIEDIGTGDITTESIIPYDLKAKGIIKVKEEGIIAGLGIAELVFKKLNPEITFQAKIKDGIKVSLGEILAEITGPAQTILKGERIALNFLQKMSGITTTTYQFCQEVKDFPVRITDTRKTTPGLRILEKYAVRIGGGYNHRFGLYDAVLIKDNHLAIAGGVKAAISSVRKRISHTMKIEVEVENLSQLQEALEMQADIIMLDNMDLDIMRKAVKMAKNKALIEASGGITLEKAKEIAQTGVDLISVGALTHSVKSLDINMEIF
ncbi:MAG: nicotinate-nucleotide diphosphorylase (carboxylating) [Candidatus Infernicultor aquiphilus]|uniref:Probable nicotinate-nucleotide pyrophosphorylase [carboxylating] n=1 Tax=Candidatus Infernicultor aquiphilus TaxID=1805029 RepID=A0A1J5GJ95_9BACT|nr:carboxylating nicotinate-nucleotide diphosphorylase [bacterium]OIP72865.1 MAG: nicotinate-nucleotide diphosphorylase (carboxylating) [Candidatus Atribacteria bacterium CG2_30_33_13]PIU24966.1 MAG: nicotinate-nucleotide diphosphorylase (carboxylating) [Candidatus Atribacteria bacterium CG08_land_8_20_14_0_20_33_29]PIW12264.1 MAG: nicotinate-nucleotide diphosphorylase (carboxylating) [Candidatus Atribacteria bacterium CG17_big_fil_post_rev_8_21_14_2_50_34_11]PIX33930.1 MAG: nicotinate-nucleoti